MLTKEAFRELTIRPIPSSRTYTGKNDNGSAMWFELKCFKCKKSCYVRKRAGVQVHKFLIKSIYSRWTTHVFGLQQDDSDLWNECNQDWNICRQRTKS